MTAISVTSTPTVSVAMAVYNGEQYLAEAVESILAQTFTDFEFIIIDDGSTDGSLSILRRYAALDRRIRLVSRPNRGQVPTLNEILEMARGELIARMDADDIALPSRLEVQVDYLRRHPECLVVGSRVLLIDGDGEPLCEFSKAQTHEEIDGAHLRGEGGAIIHPAVVMRREAFLAVGGYRAEVASAEDLDLWLRLAERGRLANVPEMLLKYRRHPLAMGYAEMEKQRQAGETLLRDAWRRRGLGEPPRPAPDGRTRLGPADHHRIWAWWALGSGYVPTARKHAFRLLCLNPLSFESWRVVACALRGH
jgi:glycosyltransferase involved in cell wall biosynthesis